MLGDLAIVSVTLHNVAQGAIALFCRGSNNSHLHRGSLDRCFVESITSRMHPTCRKILILRVYLYSPPPVRTEALTGPGLVYKIHRTSGPGKAKIDPDAIRMG